MKSTILKSALFLALAAGTFASCVNDDDYATPSIACTETSLVKTIEVSAVPASATLKQYVADDVIEAYVTSSDEGGNFFKSISFQTLDGSKAFSVPVDATSTFVSFPPGRKVFIKLKNLYTDVYNDGMRIGAIFVNTSGVASVGRMPLDQYKSTLVGSCTMVNEDDLVETMTIAQAKSNSNINRLIDLEGVQFADNAVGKTYYDSSNDLGGATNWNLADEAGNTVIFRTSSFANYANHRVPAGNGKVRGVMTKFGSDFQFVARTERDVQLTGERFVPLLNEGFDAGLNGWSAFSVTGAEGWTWSATFGNPGGMVKMSGFASSANHLNEDWLISPSQDLSGITTGTLSFDNAYKFDGAPIEVLISNNYVSGSPTAASVTWTPLTGAVLSLGNYVYVNSGLLNINAFAGAGNSNVHVAFKYTSTTLASSTWEVDNVKIAGN
jgi:hypothetical protein